MTEIEGALVSRLLQAQSMARALTMVTIGGGFECRVHNVAVGRDAGESFDNFTTNISPTAGEPFVSEFFHANDVMKIVDHATGRVLFAA